MSQIVDESISERRFESFLLLIFASIAFVLAVVGIYGVMSSLSTQRTQEIGVRMALGAQRADVLRMVIKEGLRTVLLGVAIGASAAFLLIRSLKEILFGVKPGDPMVYLSVCFAVIIAGCIASSLPAIRAAKMDPLKALRYE